MTRANVMKQIARVQARNRREFQYLLGISGMTPAELDADLTAPDPSFRFTGICGECPVSDTCQNATNGATTCPMIRAYHEEMTQAHAATNGRP